MKTLYTYEKLMNLFKHYTWERRTSLRGGPLFSPAVAGRVHLNHNHPDGSSFANPQRIRFPAFAYDILNL